MHASVPSFSYQSQLNPPKIHARTDTLSPADLHRVSREKDKALRQLHGKLREAEERLHAHRGYADLAAKEADEMRASMTGQPAEVEPGVTITVLLLCIVAMRAPLTWLAAEPEPVDVRGTSSEFCRTCFI